jgi:hypothetical protein
MTEPDLDESLAEWETDLEKLSAWLADQAAGLDFDSMSLEEAMAARDQMDRLVVVLCKSRFETEGLIGRLRAFLPPEYSWPCCVGCGEKFSPWRRGVRFCRSCAKVRRL